MLVAKSSKGETINVRVPEDLKRAIEEDASESGWGISDQIRFELMHLRGMWKGPHLPTRPASDGNDSEHGRA